MNFVCNPETPNVSISFQTNQLKKFVGFEVDEETEEIELSLGLSLGGKFGVDPKAKNKLVRSSSIPEFVNPTKDEEILGIVKIESTNGLGRTFSLPTETEEWRKRKEMQSMRRMEAKRKRLDKQRNIGFRRNGLVDENWNGFGVGGILPNLVSSGREVKVVAGNGVGGRAEASIGSQGSGGISDTDSQLIQETKPCNDGRSTAAAQEKTESKPPVIPRLTTAKPGKANGAVMENVSKEAKDVMGMNVMEEMPCVSTRGLGPNAKRIEGFLYRYRKGEEVRIVCVCHGSFLTPAEFVKHAGGGDVAHPLKHIVVNPTSSL
ncbi:Ethylene-responsive binding factor-associated repression [Dillenia turbinata]|uniref:Ninja-family protein n=1 Tax=Dillenia turbinata TaxID=194707 RepID=A0AAN8ULF5_9MAGN